MLPARRNKIDISKLNPQEQQLFAKYGKLPTHKNVLTKMQKERKYFDSGDYALSKAGVTPQSTVGTAIPNPENIPHASSPGIGNGHQMPSISPTASTSPVNRESGLAHETNTNPEGEEMDAEEDPSAPAPVAATTTETSGSDTAQDAPGENQETIVSA